MNINQVARLLNNANKKTVCGTNSIEQYHGQDENYYKLEKRDNKWVLLFIECERDSYGKESIEKIFNNEDDASKYYYLSELSYKYYKQYIAPFKMNNKDINIGEPNCTISNLKEALKRLGVSKDYYDFNNVKKEHSICLEKISKNTSRVRFIGNGKKVILVSLELENWDAYYAMYMDVYYLFLLDKHCEWLIKNKEIELPFTDEEYSIFLK